MLAFELVDSIIPDMLLLTSVTDVEILCGAVQPTHGMMIIPGMVIPYLRWRRFQQFCDVSGGSSGGEGALLAMDGSAIGVQSLSILL